MKTDQDQINALNQTEAERVRWMTVAINAWSEINALKAQVNCLRDALTNAAEAPNYAFHYAKEALAKTPEQCLAKVKAKAIEEYRQEQAEMKQMELATKLMVSSI